MPDMRFAPPRPLRIVENAGGMNQTSVRSYNERLVMSLLRQHDQLSRMELGQLSGLSAQTISVMVRALQRDGLIIAGEAQRGRVGPPSTPMSLNPDGAFAIGVKIGIKSTDTVLIDFTGAVRHALQFHYDAPRTGPVLEAIGLHIAQMRMALSPADLERITGLGLALPEDIEDWPGADWAHLDTGNWSGMDFEALLAERSGLPVYLQNDVTAAAGSEVMFGSARGLGDFAYFFIGARASSRLILNHHVYAGRATVRGAPGRAVASLGSLEHALIAAGEDPALIWQADDWPADMPAIAAWIETAGESLAEAVLSLCAFVDLRSVIVEGRLPSAVREAICARAAAALAERAGAAAPAVSPGRVGPLAKAIGAASLPFHTRFMVEPAA